MSEFWETAFKEKRMMWGEQPIALTLEASEVFQQLGFRKILVPGLVMEEMRRCSMTGDLRSQESRFLVQP